MMYVAFVRCCIAYLLREVRFAAAEDGFRSATPRPSWRPVSYSRRPGAIAAMGDFFRLADFGLHFFALAGLFFVAARAEGDLLLPKTRAKILSTLFN